MLNLKLDTLIRRRRSTLTLEGANGPAVVELRRDAPLIPVVGSPNSGKTVLALLLAEQLLEQGYGVIWYTRAYLRPGEAGYTEDHASRLALHLESHYPESFMLYQTEALPTDEVLTCPAHSVLIIDSIDLLPEERGQAQAFVDWATNNDALLILIAERPEGFYRIGLTDRDTRMASLMLIGHLDADPKQTGSHSQVRQRLASHRFLSQDHTEFLAITPKPLWSDIIHVRLPQTS